MASVIRTFQMRDGAELHFRHWQAPHPKGAVVLIHGIQSHSGWYENSCSHLSAAGYDVSFLDRRGSGLNKASRGDVATCRRDDSNEYADVQYTAMYYPGRMGFADDLDEFVDDVRRRHPGLPVHLVAISWGAKLAVASCIRRPDLADSLLLMNPGLVSRVDLSFADKLRTALALVTRPARLFDVPLGDARLFTDNPERIAFIKQDPLALRKVTARFLYHSRWLDRFVRWSAEGLRVPVLMMISGRDRIVDNDGSRKLFERFASRPKEVILYETAAHTLEFEPDPKPFFADMVRWLDARSEHG